MTGSGNVVQVVQGARHLERERTDPGAAQRGEVPANAEGGAEVAGKGAHVCAGRALDGHVDVEQVVGAAQRMRLEAGHGDRTRGQFDRVAGAHPLVGPLAVDLDRRDRARHLLDRAGERPHRGAYGIVGHVAVDADETGSPSASSVTVAVPSRIVAA